MKTSLYVDSDLIKQVKVKALGADSTMTDAVESALKIWMERDAEPSLLDGLSATDRALVERVAELARSGTEAARERIKIIRLVAKMPLPGEIER